MQRLWLDSSEWPSVSDNPLPPPLTRRRRGHRSSDDRAPRFGLTATSPSLTSFAQPHNPTTMAAAPPPKRVKLDSNGPTLEPEPMHQPRLYAPRAEPSRHRTAGPPRLATDRPNEQPTHGNFVGYYTKRPRTRGGDERLGLVPAEWIDGARVLDVGCNSGMVTVELAQSFKAGEVVGVDIDEGLIKLARRHSQRLSLRSLSFAAPLTRHLRNRSRPRLVAPVATPSSVGGSQCSEGVRPRLAAAPATCTNLSPFSNPAYATDRDRPLPARSPEMLRLPVTSAEILHA